MAGCDVSDYTDFDRLLAQAKECGMRIVLDMVLNHLGQVGMVHAERLLTHQPESGLVCSIHGWIAEIQ